MDKHSEVQDANERAEGRRRYEGFSMDTWRQGFKSMNEIFSWVRTSRFFVPSRMTSTPKEVVRGVRERMGNEGVLSATGEEIEAVTREFQQKLGLKASDKRNTFLPNLLRASKDSELLFAGVFITYSIPEVEEVQQHWSHSCDQGHKVQSRAEVHA